MWGAGQGWSWLAQGTQPEGREQDGQECAARAPSTAGARDELGVQLGAAAAQQGLNSPIPELRGAQPVALHRLALGRGNDRPLWGLLPHPRVTVAPQLLPPLKSGGTAHGAELYLLSGTRTSQGKGMVGLLSFTSITTTVSVAEPTSGGVPLSIAVTTKLRASTGHSVGSPGGRVCAGALPACLSVSGGPQGCMVLERTCAEPSWCLGQWYVQSICSAGVGPRSWVC